MAEEQLFPQLDPAEAERTFPVEFLACRDLLRFAWERRPTQPTKPFGYLLLAIFARSTLTYQAVMHLCRGGYGEQADMLNRSLFEDMATAHWVSLWPVEAIERLEMHHQHSRVLWNRVVERRPGLGDAVELDLAPETVAELDELFGRHGTRSWTGLGMWDLIGEIEQLWPDDQGREQLWRFYELAHRANNQKLHLTAFSLNRTVRAREEGDEVTFEYATRPSLEPGGPVSPALFGAFWIYWQLVSLIWDVFGTPQDELTALVESHLPALAGTSEAWKRVFSSERDRE